MTVFLFLKQFVDLLYQFQWLDYFMVLFAIVLLSYKFIMISKKNGIIFWGKSICFVDVCVIGLAFSFFLAFIHNTGGYSNFVKAESALLIYFFGRIWFQEINQRKNVLAIAGYLIIYANFIYRLYEYKFRLFNKELFNQYLNSGELYFYKTDMAIGMMIALLFVYLYGKNSFFKWFTIGPVCAYMVFYSGARMGQIIILVEYLCIVLFEVHKKIKKALKIK